ncbi:RNA-directed DNA polymerase, eukaryota [Tanacetum coccineum]
MVHDSVNSVPMWSIRTIDENIDVYRMYGNNDNLFSIKIHYAGMFTPQPGRAYVNDTFTYVDVCDIDEFSIHELNDLVQKLGYSAKVKLYYHFRKPDGDLDTSMHALGNDHDVRKLAEYVRLWNKMIEVYIEQERTTLPTYYTTHKDADFSTPKCVIQEIEDDTIPEMQVTKLKPRKPVKGQSAKMLMLEWNGEPNAVDQGQASQVTKEIGESSQPASQTMTQPSVFADSFYVASNPFLAENDFDPFLDLDTLDDADRDIPQTKTNNVTDAAEGSNREEGSDKEEGSDSDNSDGNDSDELVDNENPVEHVHVDMDTFDKNNADKLSVEDRQGELNAHEDIDVDLDAIDNEEFESASDEDGLERVRQRKLKQLRKQNKPKHGDVHKYYFYVGQEFVSREKVKDRVHRHSVETRRELFLKKNDKQRVRAECRRKIPVFEPTGNDGLSQGAGPSQKRTTLVPQKFSKGSISIWVQQRSLLTALGIDSNNGIYPLAYRIVESELKDSWTWFLEHLKEDLELQDNSNFTFISDKQKPLRHCFQQLSTDRSKTDMLLNNMFEVLNSQLLDGRDRPIISALEYAKEYMMKRIVVDKKAIAKCVRPLTSTATRLFEAIKNKASEYNYDFNGRHLYVVSGPWQDQHVVDVLHRTCTCRKWELTGMQCKHVVAANWNMAANNMEVGLPKTWCHPCYILDTWRVAYSHHINPIRGKIMWPESAIPTTIIPPKFHHHIGRPTKKRKKSAGEYIPMVKHGKLSRRSKTVTCVLYHIKGHNKRSCKGPTSGQATKTKTVQGGSNKKRPADGSSERNVVAKKTKTIIPTQASQTTQESLQLQ